MVGGGAAGFFGAIACAEALKGGPGQVLLLEKTDRFLSKVSISGGGRCNVTHACFDPRELALSYPRGGQALIGAFCRFQPRDTVAWFEERGVGMKTEDDGRIFPTTDSSATIVNCLSRSAEAAGVQLRCLSGVRSATSAGAGRFHLELSDGTEFECERLLLATGGCKLTDSILSNLGHSLEPPVPSLFSFLIETPWLREISGVSVADAEISIAGSGLREQGPLLITHRGLSGPSILRLSAWGARILHGKDYRFPLQINWLPTLNPDAIVRELVLRRQKQGAKLIVNAPIPPLPSRLWEKLVLSSGIASETRWSGLDRSSQHRLVQQLVRTELPVSGRNANKDEFVTCGGARLSEVNFKTMESRICPGLYLAGELLDIDGITGGYNFQAAWTTGWIAGRAMAESLNASPLGI